MATQWKDVAASPDFAALSDEDKDVVRESYFERVVAPELAPEQVEATRERFNTATGFRSRRLPDGVKPSTAGAGRGNVSPASVTPPPEALPPAMGWAGRASQRPAEAQAPAAPVDSAMPGVAEFATGEQPQEPGAAVPAEPAQAASFAPIAEGKKGLKSGFIGLKQMANAVGMQGSANAAAVAAGRLEVFDKIDSGELKDALPMSGGIYEKADPKRRALIRKSAEKVLAENQDAIKVGMEAYREYQRQQEEQKGQTDDFTDINSPAAFGNWLAKNGMAGLVSMAPLLVAGAATGGPGAALLGVGMGVGETVGRRVDNLDERLSPRRFDNLSPDRRDDAIAAQDRAVQQRLAETSGANLSIGAVSGALDVVAGPVRGVVSGALRKAVAEGTKELTAKGIAKEVAKDIAEEAATGALQEVVQIGGDVAVGDRDEFATMRTAKDVFNAAAAEGAGGAAGGAARVAYQAAAIAYDKAKAGGFNVDPPLKTDEAETQHKKTTAIFENTAAQYGIPATAVARAKTAAEGLPIDQLGPFYSRFVQALQKRNLVEKTVDENVLGALEAGPVVLPEERKAAADEAKASKTETKAAATETAAPETDYSGLSEPSKASEPAATPAPAPSKPATAPVPAQEAEKEAVSPAPAATTFKTAKGSVYEVHDDGTTSRNKAARSEVGYEGDSGPKPRSAKTVYVADARALQPPEGATWRVVDHGDGTLSLATKNEDGSWGIAPASRNVKVETAPRVGLAPLELWSKQDVQGLPAYKTMHPGNKITEVATAKQESKSAPQQPDVPAPSGVVAKADAAGGDQPGRGVGVVGPPAADAAGGASSASKEPAPGVPAPSPVGPGGAGAAPVARTIGKVGDMPTQADPLELRRNDDGTVTPWLEGHELVDFDSGDVLKLPGDITDSGAVAAIKKAGAVGRSKKFFGVAQDQPSAAPAPAKKGRASRELDPETDTMLQALAKLGGVQRQAVASEFGLRPEELKHTVPVGGLKGYPFRANGGMKLDQALEALREAGYLPGVSDADAVRAFEAALHDELGGGAPKTAAGTVRDAQQAGEEQEPPQLDAEAQAEREAIMAEAGLSEAELAAIDDDDIDVAGTSNTSASAFMRAMGFTEEEVRNEQAQQRQPAQRGREETGQAEPAPTGPPPGVGGAEAGPAAAPGRPGLTDAQAFEQDYAAFDGKTVEQQVQVGDTGTTATLKMDAAKAMRSLDKREAALKELRACLKRAG